MSKKLLKRTVILLAGIFLLNATAFAKKERYLNALEGAKGNLKKDSSIAVSDSNVAMAANSWNSYIVLRINELYGSNGLTALPDSFTVAINLTIAYKSSSSGNQTPLLKDTIIQLVYNRFHGSNLRVIQQLGSNNYVKLTINEVTINQAPATSVLPYLVLENYLDVDRTYDLSCSTPLISSLVLTTPSTTDADEIPVLWSKVAAADEYDLEWTWVDQNALDAGFFGPVNNPDLNSIFYNNSTQVNLRIEQYKIPLLFEDKGVLFFRVRPVQYLPNGQRKTGRWSVPNSNGNGNCQYAFNGHQTNLNWQASTTFAEEGKRKSVVQYFDGSLKNRQTVTKDNITGTTVVAETFYDRQGRPAIQVLPAPTLNTLIKYTPKFNTYLNGAEFDKDAYDRLITPAEFCGIAAPKLDTLSGASNYYSPLNTEKNIGFNKYIPDASGFPYTETRYTQDNTGRIAAQSGVGPLYTMGTGHETKYFYATPSQEQLDALFGTEVGYANYYQKTMIKDANGQYSVSYTDMNGKTIATALAGDPPIQMDVLSNYNSQNLSENLLTKENTYIEGKSIISTTSFLVSKGAVHTFDYHLAPESLQAASCANPPVPICYDCLYDLEITISNDCNNKGLPGDSAYVIRKSNVPAILDTICGNPGPDSLGTHFNIFLYEGTVNVTKKLTISDSSMQKYREIYIRNNSCRTKEDFIALWSDSIRKGTPCNDTTPVYNDASNYRELMLADMTPPSGQYARPSDKNKDPMYDVNDPSTWPSSYNIFTTGSTPIYKLPFYFNADGTPSVVQGSSPGNLTENIFTENFEPQWAESLLQFHPEYNRLIKFESYKPSQLWDEEFDNTNTYQEALSKHFITPVGTVSGFNALQGFVVDPFFLQQNPPYSGEVGLLSNFKNRLLHYIKINGDSLNLWQFVIYNIKCGTSNSSVIDQSCFSAATNTNNVFSSSYLCDSDLQMAWIMFRNLYLQAKKSYVNEQVQTISLVGNSSFPSPAIPRFITKDYVNQTLGLNSVINNNYESYINTQDTLQAKSICESYAEYWWQQLSPCGFTVSDSSSIISQMVQVCKKGYDQNHPYGSSSIDKSKYPNEMPESFIAIIDSWAKARNKDIHACNGYLINAPKPFNIPSIVVDKPIIEKPDSCTCTRLQQLKSEAASKAYASNLSGYLKQYYQTDIRQGVLDTLEAKCAGTLNNCRFLPSIINLPPVLQCQSAPACITCDQAKALKDSFLLHYPGTITYSSDDTIQTKYNKLFANFMNYHTGFGYTNIEYLQFIDNCTANRSPDTACISMQNIISSFKNDYFKKPIHSYDSNTGCDTARWVSNYGQGKLQVAHLNEVISNGEFVPKADFPKYSSIDYYDTICLGNKLTFETRLKLPTTGHTYNPYVNDSTLYLLSNEFFFETQNGSTGIDIPIASVADSSVVYGTNGGVKLPSSLEEYRTIKIEVYPTSYKYYLDGTFVTEFPHVLYTKFQGYDFSPYSENFRVDWMKISDENGQVLMFEDFNNGCGNLSQVNKEPCKPDCQTSFVQYYNESHLTNYTYTQIDSISISHCGKSLEICTTGTTCDSLDNIVYSFKDQYYKKPLHLYNSLTGCDTARWISNYGEGKLQVTPLSDVINNGRFITKADNSGNRFSSIDYYDTICLGNKLTIETRLKMPKTGHAFNIYYGDTTLYSFSNLYYFHTRSRVDEFVDLPVNSFADGGTILYSIQSSDGTVGPVLLPTDFSDYKTIKLEVTPTTYKYYIDGTFVAEFYHQLYTHFQGYNFQPMESTFDVDWMKISDENGQVLMFEDFDKGCGSLDQINKNPCQPDCQIAFASFYNQRNSTQFDFNQIDSIYFSNCGKSLNVCNGPNTTGNSQTLCGRITSDVPPITIIKDSACSDVAQLGLEKGMFAWKFYQDSLNNEFDRLYIEKCMSAAKLERLAVTHSVSEYNYTLYFYDRASNLVKTVPPAGVTPNYDATWLADVKIARENRQSKTVNHTLTSDYRYNSLNQVAAQKTPDAGVSQFWYDRIGRLVLSQNAKQQPLNQYSYTVYDTLGRITEVGQKENAGTTVNQDLARDRVALKNFINANNSSFPPTQVTQTVYDELPTYNVANIVATTFAQQAYTLRNRVSYTKFFDQYTYGTDSLVNPINYTTATYYNYDIHGNVKQLLNDYTGTVLGTYATNNFKLIEYDYDLISGKVNKVSYQPGKADQFYHRYAYDADNKITDVFTTTNPLFVGNTFLEDHEAFYQYYKHGPLARIILGQQQVQGVDFAYTLQGWLKGVNTTVAGEQTYDMGGDGSSTSNIARDAYGFSLYYSSKDNMVGEIKDYTPINSSINPFASWTNVSGVKPMYNGNISAMSLSIPSLSKPLLYSYNYDQLNRLKRMTLAKNDNIVEDGNTWGNNPTLINDFKESVSYDANGNILSYNRNGNTFGGGPLAMDSLTYHYKPNTNQLDYITDPVNEKNYSNDIDGQSSGNYSYDNIGNLIKDNAEGINTIEWTVYGKIKKITKANGTTITYNYGPDGNRISEEITKGGNTTTTAYVRDAQGNIMSVYKIKSNKIILQEQNIYGSSRLGIYKPGTDVTTLQDIVYPRLRGNTLYELTNHLGNVLATVSDNKIPVLTTAGNIDYFKAEVKTANDYYPFGMLMPGRTYEAAEPSSPAPVLLKIEAEDYSALSGVNAETTNDEGGGKEVRNFDLNDWLDYPINVPSSGIYTLKYRVSNGGAPTQFQMKKADGTVLTTVDVPYSYAFQTLTTTLTLEAGNQTLRLQSLGQNWSINWFELSKGITSAPSQKIEAESYTSMSGVALDATNDVGGGQYVRDISTGDYMNYNVNAAVSGIYNVNLRVSAGSQGQLQFKKADGSILSTVDIPYTSDWKIVRTAIPLTEGDQPLQIYCSASGWVINWFEFVAPSINPSAIKIEAESFNAMSGIQTEATSDDGAGSEIKFLSNTDWVEYSVNSQSNSFQTIELRVANGGTAGPLELKRDDGSLLGIVNVPNTGGDNNWMTISTTVLLRSGNQTMRIYSAVPNAKINWLKVVTSSKIRVEAEFPTNGVGSALTNDFGGGYSTYPASGGDHWDYPVIIPSTGKYTLNFRVANSGSTSQVVIRKSDGTVLSTVDVPGTGSFQNWTTVSTTALLEEGSQNLIIYCNGGSWVMNWFDIVSNASVASPVVIEAESYTAMNGVESEVSTDECAGGNIKSLDAGDWMDYAINPLGKGMYTFNLRVAASVFGKGQLQLKKADGSLLAVVDVPATNDAWVTVSTNALLEAGSQAIRVYSTASGWKLNWFRFGMAPAIRIEAENSIAKNGTGIGSSGDAGGGLEVGWVDQGNWLDYEINPPVSGKYTINLRVANGGDASQMQLKKADGTILSTVNVPSTGAYYTWITISTTVTLDAGNQTLRIYSNLPHWDINWFEVAQPIGADIPEPVDETKTNCNNSSIVNGYRYGFNGKENDNEVKGEGNQQDYGARIYDPRIGRFLSIDPLQKQYPWYTPYQFAGNTPLQAIDLDGAEEYHYKLTLDKQGKTYLQPAGQTKFYNEHNWFGGLISFKTRINVERALVEYEGKKYYIGFQGSYGRGNENGMALFNEFKKNPVAPIFPSIFLNSDQSYNVEEYSMAVQFQTNTAMYGLLTSKAWYTPREESEVPTARSLLNRALRRQNLKSTPQEFREKWSDNDGYDYEVRIHNEDNDAPAGSNSATGRTLRVGRRKQAIDKNGQGSGWEYADDKGNWHRVKDLKSGKSGANAANETHIPLKQK